MLMTAHKDACSEIETDDGQAVLLSATVHFCFSSTALIHHLPGRKQTFPLLLTRSHICLGDTSTTFPCMLVPLQRWMRPLCGKRSCSRWTPHRCPSSPHPPPHTGRPCPPSAAAESCWGAAREAAGATADLQAHPQPPSSSPPRPAEGRWRAAAPAE